MATDEVISEYSRNIDDLLNVNNPTVLYDEIYNTINELYRDTVIGKIKLINQTEETTQFYEMQEKIPLESVSTLLVNKGNSYKGYHRYKIKSVMVNPEEVLEYIEPQYSYLLMNLKNIRLGGIKNLDTYRKLNRLYFKFAHDDIMLLTNSNLFRYFFHFDAYDNTKDSSESLAISLFSYLLIKPIYVKVFGKIAGDFKYTCFTTSPPGDINIEDDELNIQKQHIYDGFDNYISNNISDISTEISSYLAKQVFVLNEPSESFIEDLNTVVNPFVDKVRLLFNDFSNISNNFQQTIALNSITGFSKYLTTKNILEREDYLTISNETDILNDENYIDQKFKELMNGKERPNLTSLELISFQFKDFPLYFINSRIVSYNNYLNDVLQDSEFLNSIDFMAISETGDSEQVPNVTDWISRINIDTTEFETYINSIDISSEYKMSRSLEYAHTYFFLDIISRFVDSDEFHELIVVDLVKSMRELSSYVSEYREMISRSVGQIKLFIKIFLIKELLDKKLFGELFSEFELAFDKIEGGFSNTNIDSVISSLKNPTDNIKKEYLKFYKGVFYSSSISSVLNKVLDVYRI